MAYRPCGCYVHTNGVVIIRCATHGAKQWHEGGRQAPVTHPDEYIPLEGHRSDPNAIAGGSPSQESWGYSVAVDRRQ